MAELYGILGKLTLIFLDACWENTYQCQINSRHCGSMICGLVDFVEPDAYEHPKGWFNGFPYLSDYEPDNGWILFRNDVWHM